nr:LINE-type retrotransposon LIb DNA [Ipomoea batatas]
MQVEETQVPPPIAKHGAWMIVNRKSKGSERGPAKSTDKKRWDSNHNLTIHSNGTNAARRVRRTVDSGRVAVNAATQVPTTTKHAGKGKQVDTIPVANTFAYLQDLENLQETPVLLEADTVSRGASKSRNHLKNNKGKKQTMVTQGTSSAVTGIFSNGSSAVDQLFVFGNSTGAPPNPPSANISDNLAHAKVSDFILPNRSWDFDRLQDILPSEEVDKIRAIPIPLDEQGPDALYWPNSPGGAFSVREAYRYIAGGESTDEADWVWKLKISERCRTFLWLTAKDKLLTNEAQTRRQLMDDSSCMACGNLCEDAGHIFKHCDIARVCWRISQTPNAFHHGASPTFSHWPHQNCSSVDIINGLGQCGSNLCAVSIIPGLSLYELSSLLDPVC